MNSLRRHARYVRWLPLVLWLCRPAPLRANETVRQVQEELRKRSLYFGDIDGRDTPQVTAALRTYQQRKGFPPTGALDDTTLRSLQLLPALPSTATAASSSPTPAPAATVSPWPDITVLRSDEARHNITPPALAETPTAAPPSSAPAPAAVPPPASASLDEARVFLHAYLQAGQTNDTAAELRFYADHVDYFDDGIVDKHFIEKDVNRYDHRWPQRQFTVLEPLSLDAAPDGDQRKSVLHFRMAFANKNPRVAVNGKVDETYMLSHDDGPDGGFHILGMKEQRVREN